MHGNLGDEGGVVGGERGGKQQLSSGISASLLIFGVKIYWWGKQQLWILNRIVLHQQLDQYNKIDDPIVFHQADLIAIQLCNMHDFSTASTARYLLYCPIVDELLLPVQLVNVQTMFEQVPVRCPFLQFIFLANRFYWILFIYLRYFLGIWYLNIWYCS